MSSTSWHLIVGILVGFMPSMGCVKHIMSYDKKTRAYESEPYAPRDEARTAGSLWSEGAAGLFEDARARRTGDILTIAIDERSDATRDARTQAEKSSELTAGLSEFFFAMQALQASNPNLDLTRILDTNYDSDFEGGGTTKRSGNIRATLPVRIKNVLPNGDFYVEGSKVVLLNDEESHLYLSGVVRPIDIQPDNSVQSKVLADVELEYTGRGVLAEKQQPGLLGRVFDYIWPF